MLFVPFSIMLLWAFQKELPVNPGLNSEKLFGRQQKQ